MKKYLKSISLILVLVLCLTSIPVSADNVAGVGQERLMGVSAAASDRAASDQTASDRVASESSAFDRLVSDLEKNDGTETNESLSGDEKADDGRNDSEKTDSDTVDDNTTDSGKTDGGTADGGIADGEKADDALIDETLDETEADGSENETDTGLVIEEALSPLNGSYSGTITAGVYRISAYGNSNYVLATAGDSMERGANLELAVRNDKSFGQLFYITPKGDGTYLIENVNSGFVLDAESAGTTKGTNIRQYKSNGTVAQNWKFTEREAGVYTIGAAYCSLVYDVESGNIAPASNVRLWKSNLTTAQKWQLTRVADPLSSGTYYVKNTGTGLVMETEGGSCERRANVDVAANQDAVYQRLMISTPDNGVTYHIRNLNSRLTLDVVGADKTSGTNIQQHKINNTPAQDFKIIPLGNGSYRMASVLGNVSLAVNGTNVCIMTTQPAMSPSQTWTVSAAPTDVAAGTYIFKSAKDQNKVIDICGGSWVKGANVQISGLSASTSIVNQQFELTALGDGWFTITNIGTGKVFDKAGGESDLNNNNIQQYKSNLTTAQKWKFVYTGDGDGSYYIMNGLGKYVDIQGGFTDNGTNVQVHKLNRTAAQKWYLEPTAFSGTGWRTVNTTERRYYRNGEAVTGWQTIRGYTYYFYPSTGLMAYMNDKGESPTVEGKTFDKEGHVVQLTAKELLANVKPGGKSLTNLIQNALIPCGRVLYIWGGGWGDVDANKIGYLSSWGNFFNTHATSTYNRKNYEWSYGSGLDCSGYMAWVVYNTQYTKNNMTSILYANGTSYTSTRLAQRIASLGFGTYTGGRVQAYSNLKPGDIVSMDGHIWMYLGSCSDGSGVIIHSSPLGQTYGGGVQLSGTTNAAGSTNSEGARLAKAYMDKYFSYWPYPTYVCSNTYHTSSVGYCRWNYDPDGLKNMTAAQVLETVLGKI